MTITIDQMVQREVLCCMSSVVSTLANSGHDAVTLQHDERSRQRDGAAALGELVEQAFELACPIQDYAEAAYSAGYDGSDGGEAEWCQAQDIEPYEWEVFEHWAVTGWFADKLIYAGEKVDKDFGGLCVWARTVTGQGIACDSVVQRIYDAMMKA